MTEPFAIRPAAANVRKWARRTRRAHCIRASTRRCADFARRFDQIDERRADFLPLPGLEAAIRVDPELSVEAPPRRSGSSPRQPSPGRAPPGRDWSRARGRSGCAAASRMARPEHDRCRAWRSPARSSRGPSPARSSMRCDHRRRRATARGRAGLGENGVELLGRADEVEMQAGDSEGHGGVEIVIKGKQPSCPRFSHGGLEARTTS